jgi:endonuclease/exonuclease/phosphatase (EEP) superfamily protein YafD
MRMKVMRALLVLTYSYLAGLLGWFALQAIFGDRWWWLFLLTALATYLFAPLLAVPVVALATRRHELWLGFGLGLLLWFSLYGGLFVPFQSVEAQERAPVLRVMTYNMLRHNLDPAPVVNAIQAADADVVAIQELNVPAAEALRQQLIEEYPYQMLDPGIDKTGMGVISRYPLHSTGQTLPGEWFGDPQILELSFGGTTTTLISVHAISTSIGRGGDVQIDPERMEWSIRERERQMHTLAAAVEVRAGPVIVVGDLNTGDQSRAYATVAAVLNDAWREAGAGLGHTFPGASIPGSSRPSIMGVRVPMWLIRIDYIFTSDHWRTADAWLGPWDGLSDHRPVMARLVLEQ